MAEVPPPLPPKTKKPPGGAFFVVSANDPHRDDDTIPSPEYSHSASKEDSRHLKQSSVAKKLSQVAERDAECEDEMKTVDKVIAREFCKLEQVSCAESDHLYENVSSKGVNYIEQRLNNIVSKSERETTKAKKKTPRIEVRQEENKTVVKISIKDTPNSEEETNGANKFEEAYANGFVCVSGRGNLGTYENVVPGGETRGEELSGCYYENVEEHMYENGMFGRGAGKSLNVEAVYCESEGENGGFETCRNHIFSVTGCNLIPTERNSFVREDDDSYENIKADYRVYVNENLFRNGRKPDETAEKGESGKSAVAEDFLQRPTRMVKVEKTDAECAEENSSGDPFDSGTCSDVDSLPTLVQSKKGNVIVTIKSLGEDKSDDKKMDLGHGRAESLTSSGLGVDSEESDDEKSNISCDSLNSNDLYVQTFAEDHGYHTPNSEDKTGSPVDRMDYENVISKTDIIQQVADASRKIKSFRLENVAAYTSSLVRPFDFEDSENVCAFDFSKAHKRKPPPPTPIKPTLDVLSESSVEDGKKTLPKSLLRDIRSRNVRLLATYPGGEKQNDGKNVVTSAVLSLEAKTPLTTTRKNDGKHFMVEEKTYEERKNEKGAKIGRISAMEIDTDKFYKFHLAENSHDQNAECSDDHEETFAGIKNFLSSEKPAAITSAKGTIRGVKNRVKAGIATFLQLHENKSYKDRDAGKVVVYTTTMGIVRDTYHKCLKVKQILRTLMVKFEERDVFMSAEAQEEIRDRMKCDAILVPQVFVEGQHIGDAETIDRLNEMGDLRTMLKPYKSADVCSTCKVCGGYRLLPCSVCKGSKKSIHRNHFTAEFIALKCMNCDQVGLTRCYAC